LRIGRIALANSPDSSRFKFVRVCKEKERVDKYQKPFATENAGEGQTGHRSGYHVRTSKRQKSLKAPLQNIRDQTNCRGNSDEAPRGFPTSGTAYVGIGGQSRGAGIRARRAAARGTGGLGRDSRGGLGRSRVGVDRGGSGSSLGSREGGGRSRRRGGNGRGRNSVGVDVVGGRRREVVVTAAGAA